MNHATEMMQTHPHPLASMSTEAVAQAIERCLECAQACTACADACLAEDMIGQLRTCIRLNMDCADICSTTERSLSRMPGADLTVARALLEACMVTCRACGMECRRHAQIHEHCRICAEACEACEQACLQMIAMIDGLSQAS